MNMNRINACAVFLKYVRAPSEIPLLLEKIEVFDRKVTYACSEAMILGEMVDGLPGTYVDFPDLSGEFLKYYVSYLEAQGFASVALKNKKLTLRWSKHHG